MKSPSLQKTAALSAVLHVTFFLLAFLVLRKTNNIVMSSPYVVSLVSPGRSAEKTDVPPSASITSHEAVSPSAAQKKEAAVDEKKTDRMINESISEIKAKKKIERLARLRALVSVQGKGGQKKTPSPAKGAAVGAGQGGGEASYADRVAGEIHEEWHWPDYMKKNLEAVISITIQRDGTISQVQFEKKSGDRFFDRAALQAIAKASPVTPPPYEMEIGVRFYP